MADLDLQCILLQGTIIYLARGISETINLIFILEELVNNLESCKIYPNDHGLDHEFLQSYFLVKTTPLAKAL